MERTEALDTLRRLVPRGTEVLGVVRKVNRNGDRRTINFLVPGRGEVVKIDGYMVSAGLATMTRPGSSDLGLDIWGGGMDMVAATVMRLARELYEDDTALKYRSI